MVRIYEDFYGLGEVRIELREACSAMLGDDAVIQDHGRQAGEGAGEEKLVQDGEAFLQQFGGDGAAEDVYLEGPFLPKSAMCFQGLFVVAGELTLRHRYHREIGVDPVHFSRRFWEVRGFHLRRICACHAVAQFARLLGSCEKAESASIAQGR